jgi:ribosomal protein S3AE
MHMAMMGAEVRGEIIWEKYSREEVLRDKVRSLVYRAQVDRE